MEQEKRFKKVLNAGDVLVTAFGAMIGWGWVVSSGGWIQSAGTLGTVIGFIIGGIMIYFVGLTYAELTTAMPKCGGEHLFSHKACGPVGSFICTWAIILSYIGVVCFEACSFPTIIQYIFPEFMQGYLYTIAGFDVYATWLAVAVVTALLIMFINIRGVKAAAILQMILTITIAVVGILLVAASAINGSSSNLNGQLIVGEDGAGKVMNVLSIAVIAPFFLFGFDVIPQAAEEINVPLKKVGRILILSIILAVSFYALVVFAVGYAMNPSEITDSVNGSGLVTADAMAKVFNSSVMAKVLIIGGMCGIVTSWNSFLIGGSRAMFSMGEAYMIPHVFAKLHKKHKTPVYSLLLIGLLSVVAPFFGRKMLVWISDAASFACCVAYCMVAISFLIIRKKYPKMHRPYKLKHYRMVGIIAILLSGTMVVLYLVPGSGCSMTIEEWIITGGWTLLGVVFAILCKLKYKEKFGSVVDENELEPVTNKTEE